MTPRDSLISAFAIFVVSFWGTAAEAVAESLATETVKLLGVEAGVAGVGPEVAGAEVAGVVLDDKGAGSSSSTTVISSS